MKGFDVLKIKSAVKSRNKFDLSRTHLTTMDFGEIVPLFVEETIPGDKFQVRADFFARLAPLVKPTYGKFKFNTLAAFVPYHQIAYDAESWLAGKTTMEGRTPLHRFITPKTLTSLVVNFWSVNGTASNCDFVYIDSSSVAQYRKLTAKGKYYVKILNSLGYTLPENVSEVAGSAWITTVRDTRLSAYPLLAFFKLYNDYMSQSQRFNSSALSDLLFCIKNGHANGSNWNTSTGEINASGIYAMFGYLLLNYDNDYFTSAWQSPNNPLNTVESVSSVIYDNELISSDIYNTTDVAPVVSNTARITQKALDWLKAFDDWVRRNNYSGSRSVQQIYSRFGIKPDDFRAHYAHVISTDSMPIQIGDITSTADTGSTGMILGDYAGKGIESVEITCA